MRLSVSFYPLFNMCLKLKINLLSSQGFLIDKTDYAQCNSLCFLCSIWGSFFVSLTVDMLFTLLILHWLCFFRFLYNSFSYYILSHFLKISLSFLFDSSCRFPISLILFWYLVYFFMHISLLLPYSFSLSYFLSFLPLCHLFYLIYSLLHSHSICLCIHKSYLFLFLSLSLFPALCLLCFSLCYILFSTCI